jgi:hypothetical protein
MIRRNTRTAVVLAAVIMISGAANAQPNEGSALFKLAAAKANCVPSGFAKLTRNCDQNVGRCQRLPQSCSKGWCCP